MKSNDEYLYGGPLEVPGEPLKGDPPAQRPTNKRPRAPYKKIFLSLVFILTLALVAYGGWEFYNQNKATTIKQGSAVQDQSTPASTIDQTTNDTPTTTETKTFKASHPRISLTYPSHWVVTENDNGLRVESPSFKYVTTDTGEVTGNFRIYIRQQARAPDSQYIGDAVAIKPSEKLAYNDPAVGQLPETNLIHFGITRTDHFAYFFIAGNYSLQQNDTLGPNYGKEPQTYIIAGGYSSPELTDDMATHKVSLDYYAKTNAYKQAVEIIKSLQLL